MNEPTLPAIGFLGSGAIVEALITGLCTAIFAAVCQEACGKTRDGVHTMATVSTPGGVNMQALALLDERGAFAAWAETLTILLPRLAGTISKPAPIDHNPE